MIDQITKNTTTAQALSLANQSIATAILMFAMLMIWKKGPLIIDSLKSGYEANAVSLEKSAKNFEMTSEKHINQVDRLIDQLLADRKLMLDLARDTHRTAETIRRAVEPAEAQP